MTHDSIEKQPQAGLSRRTALRLAAVGAGILATASSVGLDVLPASAAVAWNHPFSPRRGYNSEAVYTSYDPSVWTLTGYHHALDYPAPAGTPIHAVAAGTVDSVTLASSSSWAGNSIRIRHADGYWTSYSHMQYGPSLKVGDKVSGGSQIGQVGATGGNYAPHLHLEMFRGGTNRVTDRIDPAPYIHKAPLPGSPGSTMSGDPMPTVMTTTRSTDLTLQTVTPAVADGAEWPLLPYKNASNTATNFAEVVPSSSIFSGVATFYIRNLPVGEVVSIRGTRWKKSDDSKSGLAAITIVGTGADVVKGQYVFNTEITQSTHRLTMQAYASVPGVILDYWGINAQTW